MRQFTLLFLFAILIFSGFSQNVGIGTNNPTQRLTVNGNIKATDSIFGKVISGKVLSLVDSSALNGSRILLNGSFGNFGDILISGGSFSEPSWSSQSIVLWSPFALGYAFGDANHQAQNAIMKTIIWKFPISNPYFLYDTATGRFTSLLQGAFQLDLHVCIGDSSKNLPVYQVRLNVWRVGEILPIIDITQVGFGASTFNKMQATALVSLSNGDQFYATVTQFSGTTLLLNDIEGKTYLNGYKAY